MALSAEVGCYSLPGFSGLPGKERSMKGFTPTRIPPMRRGAFTLIEVMIVIAIVLALMGLVGYAVMERRDEAKRDLAKIDLNNIRQGLKLFRFDFDRYPTDEEGIKVLWDKSAL